MREQLIQWLEEHMATCSTKSLTGLSCFGCGLQRSFVLLLKGDLVASFTMYPALIPFILLILFVPLHLWLKLKHGALTIKVLFIINAVLMVVNALAKNIGWW
ncbi:DUF2752 domain-containing protein [Halocola ammonii]